MKNISSINLGGRVISIEDSAWQVFRTYIETLHQYFIKEEGRFEIINDIGNRVAELMQVMASKRNTCIHKIDMENIIMIIGTADEFKELDSDDWDIPIASPGHYHTGISTIRSFYDETANAFAQQREFKLCSN